MLHRKMNSYFIRNIRIQYCFYSKFKSFILFEWSILFNEMMRKSDVSKCPYKMFSIFNFSVKIKKSLALKFK